jgi:hypothetical protein
MRRLMSHITKVHMSNGKWAVLWSATILKTFDTEREADAYMVGMERRVTAHG